MEKKQGTQEAEMYYICEVFLCHSFVQLSRPSSKLWNELLSVPLRLILHCALFLQEYDCSMPAPCSPELIRSRCHLEPTTQRVIRLRSWLCWPCEREYLGWQSWSLYHW